jgi:type IV pilus assembly protein PilZ
MSDSEDRRQHARRPIELKVEYKRLNAFFADYTRNISNGGTFIRTDKPLGIGTEFVFKLAVPRLEEPLSIRGQVKWVVEAGNPEEEPGMGIKFLYRDASERRVVEEIVEKLMVDSLGPLLTSKLMAHEAPGGEGEES